jgi:hypothetical protein
MTGLGTEEGTLLEDTGKAPKRDTPGPGCPSEVYLGVSSGVSSGGVLQGGHTPYFIYLSTNFIHSSTRVYFTHFSRDNVPLPVA